MKKVHIVFSIISLLVVSACTSKPEIKKPNVILIYADDLGRGMLGAYGQEIVSTPNIDRLAKGGMRFDNIYGSHYCAPARASLLTGMHDCQRGFVNISKSGIYKELGHGQSFEEIKARVHKVMKPAEEGEVFLGRVAQQAGYITAEFGKLEWGFATTPERIARHGWDYHFGYYDHQRCHGFYPPFLFENGVKVDIPGNTHIDCAKHPASASPENYRIRWNMEGKKVYSEHIIMDKLLSFLDNNNPADTKKPFFIHFPTQLPHGPISIPEVHAEFKNNHNLTEQEKEYASMVKMLDTDVGRIYNKVKEMGILDNTIFVFTGDNGHSVYYDAPGRSTPKENLITGEVYDNIKTKFYTNTSGDVFDGNDGMAGLKRANWEGGVRVPLIWFWKGKIEAGSVTKQMVSNYDFLNTLAEIVGVDQVESKDGISYAPVLFGKQSQVRDYTPFSSRMGPALVTKDGWKLRYQMKEGVFQLYYLPDDYREEKDLAVDHPEKLSNLKALLLKACGGEWENSKGPSRVIP